RQARAYPRQEGQGGLEQARRGARRPQAGEGSARAVQRGIALGPAGATRHLLVPTSLLISRRAMSAPQAWWLARRNELLKLATQHDCAFVYDGAQVRSAAQQLRALRSV